MSEMKLCKDCKHYSSYEIRSNFKTDFEHNCFRLTTSYKSPIDGMFYTKTEHRYCEIERGIRNNPVLDSDICGIEGKFWEAK